MDTPNKQIKIAIVDDHGLFRQGLIKLISLADKENKYSIIFEAENGTDMIDKLNRKLLPDIILMDIDMPDIDGYEAVNWLQKYHPAINILVISMFDSEDKILRMLRMNVKGYLSKNIKIDDVHNALENIITKGFYYTDKVAAVMAAEMQKNNPADKEKAGIRLSENERLFLKLACTDLTYQQIADKMNLSAKTIEGYREALFLRFNVKNRVSLAMFAVRNDLVKL